MRREFREGLREGGRRERFRERWREGWEAVHIFSVEAPVDHSRELLGLLLHVLHTQSKRQISSRKVQSMKGPLEICDFVFGMLCIILTGFSTPLA